MECGDDRHGDWNAKSSMLTEGESEEDVSVAIAGLTLSISLRRTSNWAINLNKCNTHIVEAEHSVNKQLKLG